jgi:ribonuclease HII
MFMQEGIVGVDEVGRGCWAGPLLVVAARLKPKRLLPEGLKDSKQLSKAQRESLIEAIQAKCDLGEGWVQPEEIDRLGLSRAMYLAVSRALMNLGVDLAEPIIMDGLVNYCPPEFENVQTVAKADSLHPIVSAASIYAKVTRDQHMARVATFYPNHGFEKHVGYGTAAHIAALKEFGITELHRMSYKPIKVFATIEL